MVVVLFFAFTAVALDTLAKQPEKVPGCFAVARDYAAQA
jgi:hypothetical protein